MIIELYHSHRYRYHVVTCAVVPIAEATTVFLTIQSGINKTTPPAGQPPEGVKYDDTIKFDG